MNNLQNSPSYKISFADWSELKYNSEVSIKPKNKKTNFSWYML